MFKKFTPADVKDHSQIKSSAQRTIRNQICERYAIIGSDNLDDLIPKKKSMILGKMQPHVQIVIQDGEPVFFSQRDGPWMPTLRLLHQCACQVAHMQFRH